MRKALLILVLLPFFVRAQVNTDHMMRMGRNSLFYAEYVLSIRYFNQVIAAKPFLSEPYYYRAVAKFYLEDYWGAEADCSASIERNPFITNVYQLRGLCRIKLGRFADAVADYDRALEDEPDDQAMWYNRVLCRLELKDYDQADADLDEMMRKWPNQAKNYGVKAQVAFERKDTADGERWLDRLLAVDRRDPSAWANKGLLTLRRGEYELADSCLTEAIALEPNNAVNYLNRALARYNQNRFSGTLADYDRAIELVPGSFIAHYNRGLLRAQVGDDNRAIQDFDFVIEREPDNILAIYNRAILREKTGDFRGAIRDYSRLLKSYPHFAYGYVARARCRRRIGDTSGATADERRLLVMQLDESFGRPRRDGIKKVRKRSDENLDDYNSLVVEDKDTLRVYDDEYRGEVQNKHVENDCLPLFALTFNFKPDDVRAMGAYMPEVERLNNRRLIGRRVALTSDEGSVDEDGMKDYFSLIDRLSEQLENEATPSPDRLVLRAVAYYSVRNFEAALEDLDRVLALDSTRLDAMLQSASIRFREVQAEASAAGVVPDYTAVLDKLDAAIRRSPDNPVLYYNRGCVWTAMKNYQRALADYGEAVRLNPSFAEAYFNRGMVYIYTHSDEKGRNDLSKAGELGLYQAYSLLKQHRKEE